MCGRFTIFAPYDEILDHFQAETIIPFTPRYNLRPSEQALVVRNINAERTLDLMQFGFRPEWMTDNYIKTKKRQPYINAKAETVFDTPAFRHAARTSRCLIPTTGFYEPKGTTAPRPQYYFQLPEQKLFSLAGIWTERQLAAGEIKLSFAIITTPPNDTLAPIHDRMPAIIHPDDYALWLSDSQDSNTIRPLLKPWQGESLTCWQVSTYVNKRGSEGKDCIEPYNT